MKVKFILKPISIAVEWYIKLEKDEKQFIKEIAEEMHLNVDEQYPGGYKLW